MDIVLGDSTSVSVVIANLSEEYETLVTVFKNKKKKGKEKQNGASAQEKLDNYFCNLPGRIKRNCPDLCIKLKQCA